MSTKHPDDHSFIDGEPMSYFNHSPHGSLDMRSGSSPNNSWYNGMINVLDITFNMLL